MIYRLCLCAPRKREGERALQMQRYDKSGLLQQPDDDLSSLSSPTQHVTVTRPPSPRTLLLQGLFFAPWRPLEASVYNAVYTQV